MAGDVLAYGTRYAPLPYDDVLSVPLRAEVPCPEARNHYAGPIPRHLTRAQVSYLPEGKRGDVALDLGCGHGIHRQIIEALGYEYYGVDYAGDAADDLVDAHALPYRDDTFDFMVSVAVLEHLAHPYRAAAEMCRVLKPGRLLVGTVAFLEPFHDNSFLHVSHVGAWQILRTAGFEVDVISPVAGWNVFRAQIEMGLPWWPTATLGRAFVRPLVWAFGFYGVLGRRYAGNRRRYDRAELLARHAGAFFFVARKATPVSERSETL